MSALDYTIVIPTTGNRPVLRLLQALASADGPRPWRVILVDDRPDGAPLPLPDSRLPIQVARSGGRGPAAARNTGWRLADTEWVAFLDDDVLTGQTWPEKLARDLAELGPQVGASQAMIEVPLPTRRRPTDAERGTAALADAWWITADMAYRRSVLSAVDGFDERFPRAYREDADLALRVRAAGYQIVMGDRVTTHPPRQGGWWASVRAQRGNADNALLRHKYGRQWRHRIGEGPGRLGNHAATVLSGFAAVGFGLAGRKRPAMVAAGTWFALLAEFAAKRIAPGPRSAEEVLRMLSTSMLIPAAAVAHRLRGEYQVRRGERR